MTLTLKEMVEKGILCKGEGLAVVGCKAYGYSFCPEICAYAKEMLGPEKIVR